MKKFLSIDVTKFQNAHHFNFMKEFITQLLAAEFESQKLKDAIGEFKTCFQEEDKYFRLSQIADQTEAIKEADFLRDKNYSWLKSQATLWAKTPYDEAVPAKKILKVLNTYKLDTKVDYRSETGTISNLISDLTQEDMLKALEDLNATKFLNQMILSNNTVESLMKERREESIEVPKGALRDARIKTDEAYAQLILLIGSSSALADDPTEFDTFIELWNANIESYQTLLKRKATLRDKADEGTEPTPSEEPTPGEEPIEPAE